MAGRAIADRYVLEQPLGGGAMSSVWLAHDSELERHVAVKLLAPAADRSRFEREARAVASLAHPNICQLYDYGEAEQGPYMILEWLPGGTLEDRLAAGRPLPDDEVGRIAHEIASGLAYAHERGLVHRDLKPANILFDGEGRAKIADFGIARIAGGESRTAAGTVLGTAAYISPEQAAGEPATPASDVYSFGAILYRMLTGRPPFVSDSALELVRMHQEDEPQPIESLRRDAPAALAAIATAALAKDAAARPRDGAALAAALAGSVAPTTVLAARTTATALLGDACAAPPTQVIPRRRPSRRRSAPAPLLLAALVVLLLAGVAAAVLLTGSGGTDAPTQTGTVGLPSVPSGAKTTTTPTTAGSTTAPTSTAQSSTQETTTQSTSTRQTTTQTTSSSTSTAATTTAPATTPPPTTTPTSSTIATTTTTVDTTTTTATP
ncbi:MAG: serine/threonine-protein kinase [Gaiellaceae bacterium]